MSDGYSVVSISRSVYSAVGEALSTRVFTWFRLVSQDLFRNFLGRRAIARGQVVEHEPQAPGFEVQGFVLSHSAISTAPSQGS